MHSSFTAILFAIFVNAQKDGKNQMYQLFKVSIFEIRKIKMNLPEL